MIHPPEKHETFTEDALYDLFGCQKQGGIRFTKKHNFVLLIDSDFSDYDDSVDGETITYIGTGEEDQKLKRDLGKSNWRKSGYAFNRRIVDPKSTLLYFRKLRTNYLVYKHRAKYVSHSFTKRKNRKGKLRSVIRFKLKIAK